MRTDSIIVAKCPEGVLDSYGKGPNSMRSGLKPASTSAYESSRSLPAAERARLLSRSIGFAERARISRRRRRGLGRGLGAPL